MASQVGFHLSQLDVWEKSLQRLQNMDAVRNLNLPADDPLVFTGCGSRRREGNWHVVVLNG